MSLQKQEVDIYENYTAFPPKHTHNIFLSIYTLNQLRGCYDFGLYIEHIAFLFGKYLAS